MAESFALAVLLVQAGKVFSLAGKLGRAFREQGQARVTLQDSLIWERHVSTFNEFSEALLKLRDAMQNPLDGFAVVAEQLILASQIDKDIRGSLDSKGKSDSPSYQDFFPDLNTVFQSGVEAVKEVTNARQMDDLIASLTQPSGDILNVLQAVHHHLKSWNRLNSPSEMDYLVEDVPDSHHLHLVVEVLKGFYGGELPRPAAGHWREFLRLARKADEDAEDEAEWLLGWVTTEIGKRGGNVAGSQSGFVVVTTAGDLWKALVEGKKPTVTVSAISLGPPFGPNIAQPKFPQPVDQSKWNTLDRALALCDAEGGDRAEAMRKLIARVALSKRLDQRQVINMPLAEFVAEAGADVPDERITRDVKAGEAYMLAIENDPEMKAVWERTRERLQAFAEVMQEAINSPEYRSAQEAERQQWQDLSDAIYEAVRTAGDELESRHFARPETIEDWERLAHIVEIPADNIKIGNLTAREIFAFALIWADRQAIKAKLAADAERGQPVADVVPVAKKPKRSTASGEGRDKLIPVLTKHHNYAEDSCLNQEPIGNNELARQAGVAPSTASLFFKKEFKGYSKYRVVCSKTSQLITTLKLLNQEFSPYILFGGKPPGEDDRKDEE